MPATRLVFGLIPSIKLGLCAFMVKEKSHDSFLFTADQTVQIQVAGKGKVTFDSRKF